MGLSEKKSGLVHFQRPHCLGLAHELFFLGAMYLFLCSMVIYIQDGDFGQDADLYDDVIITQSSSSEPKDIVSIVLQEIHHFTSIETLKNK